jgi:hypothetical protein
MSRLVVAAFLLAHGAIHAGYLSPRPAASAGGPTWPFALESSWLLGRLPLDVEAMRVVGIALTAATIGGFALAALAGLGLLPGALWIAGASVGAVASVALLVVFFHPWLVVGLLIDAAVLWVVLIARWEPGS